MPEISSYYKGKVNIINSAEIVSVAVKAFLEQRNLLNTGKKAPKHQFFVSDYTESFEQTARMFFGGKLKLKEKNLWK
jgi:glutamate racemase